MLVEEKFFSFLLMGLFKLYDVVKIVFKCARYCFVEFLRKVFEILWEFLLKKPHKNPSTVVLIARENFEFTHIFNTKKSIQIQILCLCVW